MLKNKRTESLGITLIALVVSIIVLLVLAGVNLSMLTGQNGVLIRAVEAKEKTQQANEKEKIGIAYANVKIGYNTNDNKELKENIESELHKLLGEEEIIVTNCGKGVDILIKEKNYYYTIEEDGAITGPTTKYNIRYAGDITKNGKYDGSSLENAYRIECIEDLIAFSNITNRKGYIYKDNELVGVNQRDLFEGKYIILERDLNFNSKYSYENWERTDFGDINGNSEDGNLLINEMTTGTGFPSIANIVYGFKGTFEGKEHYLYNLYQGGNDNIGFFYRNNGNIANLSISGKILCYSESTVGVFAEINDGYISNCYNYVNLHNYDEKGSARRADRLFRKWNCRRM